MNTGGSAEALSCRGLCLGTPVGHSLLGGRGPLVHHFEKVLQQLLPPVEVTKLLRYGPTESGVGQVFQSVNIFPWFCKNNQRKLKYGHFSGFPH